MKLRHSFILIERMKTKKNALMLRLKFLRGKALKIMHSGVDLTDILRARFFDDILVPKNFKPKTQLYNFWQQNFVRKTCT